MARGNKKEPKEFETKKIVTLTNGNKIEIKTVLTYTPIDEGKGCLVKVRSKKD